MVFVWLIVNMYLPPVSVCCIINVERLAYIFNIHQCPTNVTDTENRNNTKLCQFNDDWSMQVEPSPKTMCALYRCSGPVRYAVMWWHHTTVTEAVFSKVLFSLKIRTSVWVNCQFWFWFIMQIGIIENKLISNTPIST